VPDSMSIIKQLKVVGALLKMDCGDSACVFAAERKGMRTNGGCRCDLPERIRELLIQLAHGNDG